MKRSGILLAVCVAAAVLVGAALPAGEAQAFQKVWSPFGFVNVLPAEARLYDDMPAGLPGVMGNEAGLLFFINNQNVSEIVNYSTTTGLPLAATSPYKILEVKAAVSDASWFRVGYGNSATAPCQYYPAALNWAGVTANGLYFTRSAAITIPMNYVKKICISLKDNPAGVNIGKSSALIDYIRLRNANGATGWFEAFTGTP